MVSRCTTDLKCEPRHRCVSSQGSPGQIHERLNLHLSGPIPSLGGLLEADMMLLATELMHACEANKANGMPACQVHCVAESRRYHYIVVADYDFQFPSRLVVFGPRRRVAGRCNSSIQTTFSKSFWIGFAACEMEALMSTPPYPSNLCNRGPRAVHDKGGCHSRR